MHQAENFPIFIFRISVRLGEHTISAKKDCVDIDNADSCTEVEDIKIESVVVHELFDSSAKVHDIALIRLSRPVEFSRKKLNIKPVCLPTKERQQVDGLRSELQNLTVAVWGVTERSDLMSDVLMYATVLYLPHQSCVDLFNEKKKKHKLLRTSIQETHLCAGGAGMVDS